RRHGAPLDSRRPATAARAPAGRGGAAARPYAALPSRSSHALHMPAHIFLQLGLWRDAGASDRAAFDASSAWIERKHLGPAMRNYHALSWLQYELLQLGRDREAWSAIAEIEPAAQASAVHARAT